MQRHGSRKPRKSLSFLIFVSREQFLAEDLASNTTLTPSTLATAHLSILPPAANSAPSSIRLLLASRRVTISLGIHARFAVFAENTIGDAAGTYRGAFFDAYNVSFTFDDREPYNVRESSSTYNRFRRNTRFVSGRRHLSTRSDLC